MNEFEVRDRLSRDHQSDAQIAMRAGLPISFVSEFRRGGHLNPDEMRRVNNALDW